MKSCGILLTALPAAAVVLETLPYGAVLNFFVQAEDGSFGLMRQTYSYFSLTPFGYANFGPLITALLSCVLLLAGIIYLACGKGRKAIKIISIIAVLASLAPLCFGLSYFSLPGVIISVLLALEATAAFLIKN